MDCRVKPGNDSFKKERGDPSFKLGEPGYRFPHPGDALGQWVSLLKAIGI